MTNFANYLSLDFYYQIKTFFWFTNLEFRIFAVFVFKIIGRIVFPVFTVVIFAKGIFLQFWTYSRINSLCLVCFFKEVKYVLFMIHHNHTLIFQIKIYAMAMPINFIYILPWHLLGHAIMPVICFDLQFSHSTRPMTSFCIFIAYINTEGILFNVKITRWD